MIVIDSCAACEMAMHTTEGSALQALSYENEVIASCDLIYAELVSVYRKFARNKKIDPSEIMHHFLLAVSLIDQTYPIKDLQTEVLTESIRLNHSSYDMFYFVLARRLGATLFTTDRKLMKLCENHGVNCISEVEF